MLRCTFTQGWGWTRALAVLSALVPTVRTVDTSWNAPNATPINNLDRVLNDKGVYGFIFNSSHTPQREYGQYNWCNMPHVRRSEYEKAPDEYELQYIEVVSGFIIFRELLIRSKVGYAYVGIISNDM